MRRRCRSNAVLCALAVSLLIASVAGHCQDFDPQRRIPALASPAQIKAALREHIARSATLGPADRVRYAGAEGIWVNLKWHLNRMAQAGQELPDLSEFGLEKKTDGSYVIDVGKNPHWELWNLKLSLLENPQVFELHTRRLRQRGFREQDIRMLREHVVRQNSQRVVLEAERSMVRSIAVQRSQAPRRGAAAIDADDAASYVYQLEIVREQAKSNWAADLLQPLDDQRQEILMSFYQELGGSTAFKPDENFDASLAFLAEQLASGAYEQQLMEKERALPR